MTRHLSESGIAEVLDLMPIDQPELVSDRRRIVRVVRGIRGEVDRKLEDPSTRLPLQG